MDAAEPAGGEDLDPCARRDLTGRRDGGGAVAASSRDGRDVSDRNLDDVVTIGNLLKEVPRETDVHDPAQHRDGRRDRTTCPDDVLDLDGDAKVFRPWEAVADYCRLEGDNRPRFCEGARHLVGNANEWGHEDHRNRSDR